eukprot:Rmarinus@m.15312
MERMLYSLILLAVLSACMGQNQPRVIYGDDTRVDEYQASETFTALGASTVMLVSWSDLVDAGDVYEASSGALGNWVCDGELFVDQPTPGFCSGFLIADNLIATAGHCLEEESNCMDTAFVFNAVVDADASIFECESDSHCVTRFNKTDVYSCGELVHSVLDLEDVDTPADPGNGIARTVDFAVVRTDRVVDNYSPVTLATDYDDSTPTLDTDMVIIGHPSGLLRKYATGRITHAGDNLAFTTNLDTFGGNSGSAVFNAVTGEVEGILVSGATDYVNTPEGCEVPNVCDDLPGGEDCEGERVIRIDLIAPYLVLDSNGCDSDDDCGTGSCSSGVCVCDDPAAGPDCSRTCDTHGCNGNGECVGHYECVCTSSFDGSLCSEELGAETGTAVTVSPVDCVEETHLSIGSPFISTCETSEPDAFSIVLHVDEDMAVFIEVESEDFNIEASLDDPDVIVLEEAYPNFVLIEAYFLAGTYVLDIEALGTGLFSYLVITRGIPTCFGSNFPVLGHPASGDLECVDIMATPAVFEGNNYLESECPALFTPARRHLNSFGSGGGSATGSAMTSEPTGSAMPSSEPASSEPVTSDYEETTTGFGSTSPLGSSSAPPSTSAPATSSAAGPSETFSTVCKIGSWEEYEAIESPFPACPHLHEQHNCAHRNSELEDAVEETNQRILDLECLAYDEGVPADSACMDEIVAYLCSPYDPDYQERVVLFSYGVPYGELYYADDFIATHFESCSYALEDACADYPFVVEAVLATQSLDCADADAECGDYEVCVPVESTYTTSLCLEACVDGDDTCAGDSSVCYTSSEADFCSPTCTADQYGSCGAGCDGVECHNSGFMCPEDFDCVPAPSMADQYCSWTEEEYVDEYLMLLGMCVGLLEEDACHSTDYCEWVDYREFETPYCSLDIELCGTGPYQGRLDGMDAMLTLAADCATRDVCDSECFILGDSGGGGGDGSSGGSGGGSGVTLYPTLGSGDGSGITLQPTIGSGSGIMPGAGSAITVQPTIDTGSGIGSGSGSGSSYYFPSITVPLPSGSGSGSSNLVITTPFGSGTPATGMPTGTTLTLTETVTETETATETAVETTAETSPATTLTANATATASETETTNPTGSASETDSAVSSGVSSSAPSSTLMSSSAPETTLTATESETASSAATGSGSGSQPSESETTTVQSTMETTDTNGNPPTPGYSCPTNRVPCLDDDESCYYYEFKCDGEWDCPNGYDEEGCALGCDEGTFACPDSTVCFPDSYKCDFYLDCADGSDEEGCPAPDCTGKFACANELECVSNTWVCDGYEDCSDGSDEVDELCALSAEDCDGFICDNDRRCVPDSWVCDVYPDCDDGTDENTETCAVTCDESYQFACADGTQCIKANKECNSYFDCFDKSDEHDGCMCDEETQRECDSGAIQCVSKAYVCDGHNDCEDGSDEGLHCCEAIAAEAEAVCGIDMSAEADFNEGMCTDDCESLLRAYEECSNDLLGSKSDEHLNANDWYNTLKWCSAPAGCGEIGQEMAAWEETEGNRCYGYAYQDRPDLLCEGSCWESLDGFITRMEEAQCHRWQYYLNKKQFAASECSVLDGTYCMPIYRDAESSLVGFEELSTKDMNKQLESVCHQCVQEVASITASYTSDLSTVLSLEKMCLRCSGDCSGDYCYPQFVEANALANEKERAEALCKNQCAARIYMRELNSNTLLADEAAALEAEISMMCLRNSDDNLCQLYNPLAPKTCTAVANGVEDATCSEECNTDLTALYEKEGCCLSSLLEYEEMVNPKWASTLSEQFDNMQDNCTNPRPESCDLFSGPEVALNSPVPVSFSWYEDNAAQFEESFRNDMGMVVGSLPSAIRITSVAASSRRHLMADSVDVDFVVRTSNANAASSIQTTFDTEKAAGRIQTYSVSAAVVYSQGADTPTAPPSVTEQDESSDGGVDDVSVAIGAALGAVAAVVLAIAFMVHRRNKSRQQSESLLEAQRRHDFEL